MSQAPQEAAPSQAEVEKQIKDIGDEYNANVEELVELQNKLQIDEHASFLKLKKLDKLSLSGKSDDVLRKEYAESIEALEDHKEVVYAKQAVCFHLIQKLRVVQNNYLVGLINGLQEQLKAANEPAQKVDVKEVRADNLK